MQDLKRREFLTQIAAVTGGAVLAPIAVSCGGASAGTAPVAAANTGVTDEVPLVKPADWDPVAYNKARGLNGAIPETYHESITGADGNAKHLGKHLPYVPEVPADAVPEGFLPLMWGDDSQGYARHPNAPLGSPNYPKGHWYNWVMVRKATAEEAEETLSEYEAWPGEEGGSHFFSEDGGDISADGGKNTVYLVALPKDVKPGDTLRIYGHCLYHGEYVDFLTLK